MNEEEITMNNGGGGGQGLSVASLICGIGAFFPGCFCGIFGIIPAILAVIFGSISRNRGAGGMAKAGVVLGFIYIILFIISLILWATGVIDPAEYSFENLQGGGNGGESSVVGDGDGGGGSLGQDPNDGPDGND